MDEKWRNYLHRENRKLITHASCKKVTCGATYVALMACKKLSRLIKEWRFEMNPYDPYV